jgi:hypothetical protein
MPLRMRGISEVFVSAEEGSSCCLHPIWDESLFLCHAAHVWVPQAATQLLHMVVGTLLDWMMGYLIILIQLTKLIPWNRFIPHKLIVIQLVTICPAVYGTRTYITAFKCLSTGPCEPDESSLRS